MKPIMSIREARDILGDAALELSDEQVKQLIDDLDFLAEAAIKSFREQKTP